MITATDGTELESEYQSCPNAEATVVFCHPHPLHGGSMRSLVISELFRATSAFRANALRFNFRGVGNSGGTFDHGIAEQQDVHGALRAARANAPDLPVLLVGWSFGGGVAASVATHEISGWFLIAPAFAWAGSLDAIARDTRPKWIVTGERDDVVDPSSWEIVNEWNASAHVVIPGADHFFVGRTSRIAELLDEALSVIRRSD